MISVKNLNKSFGKLKVLENVSIDLVEGGVHALLGPNGSGKTTFLKILLGMVIPDGGEVRYGDVDILHDWRYRNQIGYLPQIARFPDNLTVKEVVAMIQDVRDEPSNPAELVSLFGLDKYWNQKLGNLSGGTRQKVNIVLTFMFDTPVLVLDEPTAGLDPISLIKLKEIITKARAVGKIILITSHIMSLVEELADNLVFILEGHVHFQGSPEKLKSQTQAADLEHSIATLLKHGQNT